MPYNNSTAWHADRLSRLLKHAWRPSHSQPAWLHQAPVPLSAASSWCMHDAHHKPHLTTIGRTQGPTMGSQASLSHNLLLSQYVSTTTCASTTNTRTTAQHSLRCSSPVMMPRSPVTPRTTSVAHTSQTLSMTNRGCPDKAYMDCQEHAHSSFLHTPAYSEPCGRHC